MDNPATIPLLILLGGFAWNSGCKRIANRLTDRSLEAALWFVIAGLCGSGVAIITSIAILVVSLAR